MRRIELPGATPEDLQRLGDGLDAAFWPPHKPTGDWFCKVFPWTCRRGR